MAIERMEVSEVDTKKGYIHFVGLDDPSDAFKITIEAHLMVHGRLPAVGDVLKFTTSRNFVGQKLRYYVKDRGEAK